MEYFSRYGGNTNKIAKRHEKAYIKSLFKGAVKDPFENMDKQDKDVRRFEAAQVRLGTAKEQRAYDRMVAREEKRDAKKYDKERF